MTYIIRNSGVTAWFRHGLIQGTQVIFSRTLFLCIAQLSHVLAPILRQTVPPVVEWWLQKTDEDSVPGESEKPSLLAVTKKSWAWFWLDQLQSHSHLWCSQDRYTERVKLGSLELGSAKSLPLNTGLRKMVGWFPKKNAEAATRWMESWPGEASNHRCVLWGPSRIWTQVVYHY